MNLWEEHQTAMAQLRAKNTPQQQRRADAVLLHTRGLPMGLRIRVARQVLLAAKRSTPEEFDRLLHEAISNEEAIA